MSHDEEHQAFLKAEREIWAQQAKDRADKLAYIKTLSPEEQTRELSKDDVVEKLIFLDKAGEVFPIIENLSHEQQASVLAASGAVCGLLNNRHNPLPLLRKFENPVMQAKVLVAQGATDSLIAFGYGEQVLAMIDKFEPEMRAEVLSCPKVKTSDFLVHDRTTNGNMKYDQTAANALFNVIRGLNEPELQTRILARPYVTAYLAYLREDDVLPLIEKLNTSDQQTTVLSSYAVMDGIRDKSRVMSIIEKLSPEQQTHILTRPGGMYGPLAGLLKGGQEARVMAVIEKLPPQQQAHIFKAKCGIFPNIKVLLDAGQGERVMTMIEKFSPEAQSEVLTPDARMMLGKSFKARLIILEMQNSLSNNRLR